MTEKQFIEELERALRNLNSEERRDILEEYQEHFRYKKADGYGEEEIAAKLGSPQQLASEFATEASEAGSSGQERRTYPAAVATGVTFTSLIAALVFILLGGWVVVMAASTLATAVLGTCLMWNWNIASLLPFIPVVPRILFAIASLALSVLAAAGTIYCALFAVQVFRAYRRWCHNTLASSRGNFRYPPLPVYPQLATPGRRRLRTAVLLATLVFAISLLVGYIVAALQAGNVEFWHAWQWFAA